MACRGELQWFECMPTGEATVWTKDKYMATAEFKKAFASLGVLERIQGGGLDGPAEIYRLPGAMGTLGFISPISNHFCDRCNRLRLTSEGKLRSCLLQDFETDLRGIIRNGATDQEIRAALVDTILKKPKGYTLQLDQAGGCHGRMSRIGGC
ncbi:MAG: hypothetical protein KKB30_11040 [Proteobacteria bacterium]|nr:hypothetical protein [Pseudomonadota bacterium]MBU1714565.1 hypothetical protein [Pseudomonadota bacterium]